jgi:hypothetical protein
MKVDTKNAIYNCRLRNMNVIAGSDGLNEGANPVVLGPGDPDSGYTGGADCGPCGLGSKASKEVEPSAIVL